MECVKEMGLGGGREMEIEGRKRWWVDWSDCACLSSARMGSAMVSTSKSRIEC